jgi:beta-glucosidase
MNLETTHTRFHTLVVLVENKPGVLTRVPSQAEIATMGLAATFSVKDAEDNGVVIGREAKSLGIDVVLEPFINIDRDITFDRGYNTYGEDPVLTGVMGAGLIKGIQAQGVMAQAKHYVAYDTAAANVMVDQQALHEIYVAPFVDAVRADVSSIMCSYNKVNGTYACGNSDTLIKILRKELGFKGFVTSDWGATHAASFINHGLDMEMPGPGPKDSAINSLNFTYSIRRRQRRDHHESRWAGLVSDSQVRLSRSSPEPSDSAALNRSQRTHHRKNCRGCGGSSEERRKHPPAQAR